MPMNPREVELWARTRAKGRARFIWLNGVLTTGLILAVLILPVVALIRGWGHVIRTLPYTFIMFPVGGYLSGEWTWRRMEGRYAETVNRDAET
jgi:hypothetical protein